MNRMHLTGKDKDVNLISEQLWKTLSYGLSALFINIRWDHYIQYKDLALPEIRDRIIEFRTQSLAKRGIACQHPITASWHRQVSSDENLMEATQIFKLQYWS